MAEGEQVTAIGKSRKDGHYSHQATSPTFYGYNGLIYLYQGLGKYWQVFTGGNISMLDN